MKATLVHAVLLTTLLTPLAARSDPLAFSPIGGEAFGMGTSYVADFEDESAIILNPAAAVTPRYPKKRRGEEVKTVLSTGVSGRLVLRGATNFLTVLGQQPWTSDYWQPAVKLISSGSTGRFQTTISGLPAGLSVFLRESMFSRIYFEHLPDPSHRYYLGKNSDLYEGGAGMAFLFTPRLAIGFTIKALYGYSSVGRYIEMGEPLNPRMSNFSIDRLMWGIGGALGFRYEFSRRLFVGFSMDLPELALFLRERRRSACLSPIAGFHSSYEDAYYRSGIRLSGPRFDLGVTYKPASMTKIAVGVLVNPWPKRTENDFSFAHTLVPSIGFSQAITWKHWVALGVRARLFSLAEIELPGDLKTSDIELTLLYRYKSNPMRLPWVGKVKLHMSTGIRYSYIWGNVGGVTVTKLLSCSTTRVRNSDLYVHAADVLFRISLLY